MRKIILYLLMLLAAACSIALFIQHNSKWIERLDGDYDTKTAAINSAMDNYGTSGEPVAASDFYSNFLNTHEGFFLFRLAHFIDEHHALVAILLYAFFILIYLVYRAAFPTKPRQAALTPVIARIYIFSFGIVLLLRTIVVGW